MVKQFSLIGFLSFFLICAVWGQNTRQNKEVEIKNAHDYVYYNGYKHRTTDIPDNNIHVFKNYQSPNISPSYSLDVPVKWSDYSTGNENRLCIYLVDTVSDWIGLVKGLNAIGVPFRITTNLDDALTHQIVMIYPDISSEDLDLDSFMKLRDFPINGGVLMAYNITSPALRKVFGIEGTTITNTHNKIQLSSSSSRLLTLKGDPFNRTIWINSPQKDITPIQSIHFMNPEYRPLALYEDGTAAIVQKIYSKGLTLALGVDLGLLYNTYHGNRVASLAPFVSGNSEPSIDFFFQLVKNVYTSYAKYPILFGTVPDNKNVAIVMTHILSSEKAIRSSLLFGDLERSAGIRGTYPVQTKYIKDGESAAFFNTENLPYLMALKGMGMEIGSNSVSNTPFFSYLPIGTGTEVYPEYRPYCSNDFSTFNETLLGELGVSKSLLDKLLGNFTYSFAPEQPEDAPNLYKGLKFSSYKFTSSFLSNEAFSMLPFQTSSSINEKVLYDVFEIPMTLWDSPENEMYDQMGLVLNKIDQISGYGGVVNLEVNCDLDKRGLDFEREIIDQLSDQAWFGSLSDYGFFLRGRMLTSLDVVQEETLMKIRLFAPVRVRNLPVILPLNAEYVTHTPGTVSISTENNVLIINELKGSLEIVVRNQ